MSGEPEHVVLKAIGSLVDLILMELPDDSASFADNEDAGLKEFYCGDHFTSSPTVAISSRKDLPSGVMCQNLFCLSYLM